MATMPDPNAVMHTKSPMFGLGKMMMPHPTECEAELFSNLSSGMSEMSNAGMNMETTSCMTWNPNTALFSISSPKVLKNYSSIANRGYDKQGGLVGHRLHVLGLVACMEKYMHFTGETTNITKEKSLMKTLNNCIKH